MVDTVTKSKWPRRLVYVLIAVVGIVICALIAARLFLSSESGRSYVAGKIEALQPAGQTFSIDGLKGDLLSTFTVEGLTVADADGTWLDAKNARVTWRPWRLLNGQLLLEQVRAQSVDVLALPDIKTSKSDGPQRIKSINIQSLNLPDVTLAESVLPREQTLSLVSSLSHTSEGGSLNAQATTLSDPALDKLTADIHWSPDFLISGEANIESKPGGIISNLLRMQSDKTLKAKMTSSGTGGVFETEVTGMLGAETFVKALLTSQRGVQDVKGTLNPYLLPLLKSYATMFGGDIEADLTINRERKALQAVGGLTSPHMNVSGTAEQIKGGFHFPRLVVSSSDPLILFSDLPASLEAARFRGYATWGEKLAATGTVSLKAAAYNELEFSEISGPVDVSLNEKRLTYAVDLNGRVDSVNALNRWSGTDPKMFSSGRYNLDTQTLSLGPTTINIPGVKLNTKGRVGLRGMSANLDGTFALKKNALGFTLPADMSGAFTARNTSGDVDLSYSGEAQNFENLPEPIAGLVGDRAVFDGTALLDSAQNLRIPNLTVSTDGLAISLNGERTSDGVLDFDVDYTAQPLDMAQLRVGGTQGVATVAGTLETLAFDVGGTSPNIRIGERSLADVTYKAEGRAVDGGLQADITVSGEDALGAISLDATAQYQDGNWALQNMVSEFSGLSISGDVSGQGGDITRVKSDLNIKGNPSDFIPAEAIDLSVNLANETALITGNITGINAGALYDASAEIKAQGPREAVDFTVQLTGDTRLNDISRKADIALTGTADLMAPSVGVTAQVNGNLGIFDINSVEPLTLRQTPDGYIGLGKVALLGGEFVYDLEPNPSVLNLEADGLSMASLLALSGRPGVEGSLDMTARLERTSAGFDGTLVTKIQDVRTPGSQVEPINLDINATLLDEMLSFDATSQNASLNAALNMSGPLDTQILPPFINWPPKTPLPGTLKANGDIGTLAELFLPPETNIKGQTDLDMTFTVPIDIGGVNGQMNLTDGEFEQGLMGTHLVGVSVESDFNGRSINVSNFNAKGKNGGSLTGGGSMALGREAGGAITLTAKTLQVFDRREAFASVSGALEFTRDAEKLKLSGNLSVDDAKVSLDKFPRSGLPTLEVNFGDEAEDKSQNLQYSTALDVSVTSAGRIALRGRGVNAAMALNANFSGPFEAPVLKGEASIVRGRFDFLGKRFELKDSRVLFRDNIMDSQLDAKAVRETSDLTATVRVGGTLKRPQVDLQSEPTLPEDEVLSYILFGRSASQLTTIETARLAAALAQLSGGGGFDLLGGLEDSLGLDTLDFAQSETGQTQLATGKYLSDDVYVEVRSSVEGAPGLAVEWTPRKNIAVEAETAPGDTQRLSVKWQKDFD